MSQENVELVQQSLDAYLRRDLQAMCELSHEDVELYTLRKAPQRPSRFGDTRESPNEWNRSWSHGMNFASSRRGPRGG